jgi:hypothetical protein
MTQSGGKMNKSLKAWVAFVKKVQKEEKLSYKDAIHRAKQRKDKGEKWMKGGADTEVTSTPDEVSEEEVVMTPDSVEVSEEEMTGGRRRRRTMRRSRGRGKGRTARRHRSRSRASRRH